MEALLAKLANLLQAGQFLGGEQAIRETVVLPVLQSLGWEIFDPVKVICEFPMSGRRVDYALSASPPKVDLFIETKALGNSVGADKQLFEYAYHQGVQFAVLTDGREWNFFVPGEQGSYDERRVQKLDLTERTPKDAAEIMARYLAYDRVKSGVALESAKADYKNHSKRLIAANNISKAWTELVDLPDDLLMELIAEKTESLCGFRPASEDVEQFLDTLSTGMTTTLPMPATKPLTHSPRSAKKSEHILAVESPVSDRKVDYTILGHARHAATASDALIDILQTLAKRDAHFVEKLAPVVRGRTRNHIARKRDDVYPLKPELAEYTVEFVPGWWLGTNIANRDKLRIIKGACDVAKLKFGHDLKISLPNAG